LLEFRNNRQISGTTQESAMSMWLKVILLLAVSVCAPIASFAQSYPSKPVRLVAPFPPGGATDVLARLVAQKLSAAFNQSFIVDNRPGAGGNIGAEIVAKAPADGYTLLMGSTALAINVSLYKNLTYSFIRDLAPIAQVATVPNVLVVNTSIPAHSMEELISVARAKPGKLNLASSGNGSVGHLSGEMLKLIANINVSHVPYKGSSAVINDLIGGQVDLTIESVVATLPHIQTGKLRALGVTSENRSALLPQVPTMEEQGLKAFLSSGWSGVLAPAGTPTDIIVRLNAEIAKALQGTDMKELLLSLGAEPASGTPAEFASFLKADVDRWAKFVRASGASID
jgi:tripartite-type tricarboxylate transporter receptor subunit TctC